MNVQISQTDEAWNPYVSVQGIASIDAEYIAGIGREGDRLYVLLDAEALMGGEAAQERSA